MLSRTTDKLSIDWPDEPHESQSTKLDEQFLSCPNSKPTWRKLPFFCDLHHEISRSWKQPLFSRLTNAAAADFTNLVGSVEHGYTAIPVVEDTLASHISPSLAPSWKSCPLLPTKQCRTNSALIGKSYMAAGQADMALHTMAILQAYQADVLKEMDEGDGPTPEAVKELRKATAALRQFMPRKTRDPLTPHPTPPSRDRSLPRKEPPSGAAPWLIPLRPRSGEPAADHCPTDDPAGRWIGSGLTGLSLQLHLLTFWSG